MNQIKKVEEYICPYIRCVKMHAKQQLCANSFSSVEPHYDGFGDEEDL